jgi:hypothetical protein
MRRLARLDRAAAQPSPEAIFEYPLRCVPRWGWGEPPHAELHALIGENRDEYAELLGEFRRFIPDLRRIPGPASGEPRGPHWANIWYTGLDAVALYGLLATTNPRLYMEVGSGHSTAFARRAVRDHGLRTRIISIDPHPRADIDAMCDDVLRTRLEDCDLTIIDRLDSGDIFFFDGSHLALMNSDTTVAVLEVLPRLRPGVLVQFHDIFLPWDYPPTWDRRYYGEQYLIASLLMARGLRYGVTLANHYITHDTELHGILAPLWEVLRGHGAETNGLALWLRVRPEGL